MQTPFRPTESFDDPDAALAQVRDDLRRAASSTCAARLQRFVARRGPGGTCAPATPSCACSTDTVARADSRLAYGFVAGPGIYETTLTRPDLFADYYLEQFRLLLRNHGVPARSRHQHAADSRALLVRRARPYRGHAETPSGAC